jgi:hypothetical protein
MSFLEKFSTINDPEIMIFHEKRRPEEEKHSQRRRIFRHQIFETTLKKARADGLGRFPARAISARLFGRDRCGLVVNRTRPSHWRWRGGERKV